MNRRMGTRAATSTRRCLFNRMSHGFWLAFAAILLPTTAQSGQIQIVRGGSQYLSNGQFTDRSFDLSSELLGLQVIGGQASFVLRDDTSTPDGSTVTSRTIPYQTEYTLFGTFERELTYPNPCYWDSVVGNPCIFGGDPTYTVDDEYERYMREYETVRLEDIGETAELYFDSGLLATASSPFEVSVETFISTPTIDLEVFADPEEQDKTAEYLSFTRYIRRNRSPYWSIDVDLTQEMLALLNTTGEMDFTVRSADGDFSYQSTQFRLDVVEKVSAVPEPSTLWLFGIAVLAGPMGKRRRTANRKLRVWIRRAPKPLSKTDGTPSKRP